MIPQCNPKITNNCQDAASKAPKTNGDTPCNQVKNTPIRLAAHVATGPTTIKAIGTAMIIVKNGVRNEFTVEGMRCLNHFSRRDPNHTATMIGMIAEK